MCIKRVIQNAMFVTIFSENSLYVALTVLRTNILNPQESTKSTLFTFAVKTLYNMHIADFHAFAGLKIQNAVLGIFNPRGILD